MTNDDELPQDDPYADFYEDTPDTTLARLTATQADMLLHLDVRAREVALERAVELHRGVSDASATTTQHIIFTARAFYDFLTGESDEDVEDDPQ